MKDPNILYDYIWTKEELDPYREMYDEDKWQGELVPPEVNRGDRHVWVIDGNYPDPDKIVQAYTAYLPELVRSEFMKSLGYGYSVDNKLSRYDHQQHYSWHCDASISWRNPMNSDWRRIISSITYLNDDYEGGETEYLYYKKRIKPEKGKLLIWPAGMTHCHRGGLVLSGTKYIATGWFYLANYHG